MGVLRIPDLADAGKRPAEWRSVGVLVDLELAEHAGGHVKCWQRLAEASLRLQDSVDLTVYFLGDSDRVIALGGNVRYVALPPRLGTRRFGFLAQGAGHTDLASYHPRLAELLTRHDVIHTTDVFAFGQTGRQIARRHRLPLVTSIHTDLPLFTEIYTAEIVHRTFGDNRVARFILNELRAGKRSAQSMRRKVDAMIRASDHVIVSNADDRHHAARIVGNGRVSGLRRGIDRERFNPNRRDRARLAAAFGIPEECPVLLFVGRIDNTKKALFAAARARALLDTGLDLRFLAVGAGAQQDAIASLLGPNAILPGQMPQEDLGWIYPSADVYIFPSESEILGNVVLEAKACGLPVLVADHAATRQCIQKSGIDGYVLPTADPALWERTLKTLLAEPGIRRKIGTAARRTIETAWPSWRDVVEQDLLPVWQNTVSQAHLPAKTASPGSLADGMPSEAPAD